MAAKLRHRFLTSVSAGALVGVLAATGLAAATTEEVAAPTVQGIGGCGTVETQSTWWGPHRHTAQ